MESVVATVLASSLAMVAGCGGVVVDNGASSSGASSSGSTSGGSSSGGSTSGGSSGTVGWHDACVAGKVPLLAGLRPTRPAEYTELRLESEYTDGATPAAHSYNSTVEETAGTRCAGARDVAACESAYAATRVLPADVESCLKHGYQPASTLDGNRIPGCTTEALVFTHSGVVGTAEGTTQVLTFLGVVDAPEEALLLAKTAGYALRCDDGPAPQWQALSGGGYQLRVQERDGACGDGILAAVLSVSPSGDVTVVSKVRVRQPVGCAIGRRPEGLCGLPTSRGPQHPVGDFFAECAKLEAASIHAFARMHAELTALGADSVLLERVETARKDEVRHTKMTVAIARRYGHAPSRATIAPARARTVLEIAIENAHEGCVRETYGAVVAAYQARTAQDPFIKAMLREIATDEAAHAQLSWDVAQFLEAQLTPEESMQVTQARANAATELAAELAIAPDPALCALGGMPTPAVAQAMLRETLSLLAAA